MTNNLTKEEVAFGILGARPLVRLSRDEFTVGSCEPFAAVATTAANTDEALQFAQELVHDISKEFPTWRGWAIRYTQPLPPLVEPAHGTGLPGDSFT